MQASPPAAPVAAADPAAPAAEVDYVAIQNSPEFQTLRKRQRSFVFPLAIAFLAWYIAFVVLGAFAHDFMSTPVLGNINVGVVLGLAQVATTFAITMAYVRFANRRLDPGAAQLREHREAIERGEEATR